MAKCPSVAKRVAFAAYIAMGTAPAFAQSADLLLNTTDACLQISENRAAVVGRFAELGWRDVPNTDLPAVALNGQAALLLSREMGYGEEPKPRWLSRWTASQKTATGLKNLVQIPDSPTSRHFFVSMQGSFLQVKIKKATWFTSVECSMALVPADMTTALTAFKKTLGGRPLSALPTFARTRGKRVENDQFVSSYNFTFANGAKIAALIDTPFNYTGFASTYLGTKPPTR